MRKFQYSLLLATLFMWSEFALSQNTPIAEANSSTAASLSLFEAVENNTTEANSPGRPSRDSRVTISEPEFTLIGTSRVGGDYTAMVKHKSGEVLLIDARPRENTVIQDYVDYSIVDISAGKVSIHYPNNNPCIEFRDRGVRCNTAGNIAELVLANGDPLPPINSATLTLNEEGNSTEVSTEEGDSNPANPFEALRNAQNARSASGQDGNPTAGRFTPRRINPEDVPEGMRVIATPFGDRLVEQ